VQGLFGERRSSAPPHRRLYASRATSWRRRVTNEDELLAALQPLGFETVVMDDLSVGEQARLFSEAEAIVGPNGSQLANVIFTQPDVVLVELWDSNYVHLGDWELVVGAGGHYHMLVSESPPARSQWRDIVAPVSQVLDALEVHGIN
jgi:capsular polysaccharide biosynthesis protein